MGMNFGIWLFVTTPATSVIITDLAVILREALLTRLELIFFVWQVNGCGKFKPC
jgi:hypothetical protein